MEQEPKYSKKRVIALMLFASALTCVLLLAVFGKTFGFSFSRFRELQAYSALRNEIDKNYIGDIDSEIVLNAAMYATVDSLGDEWSYYMTPAEYDDYLNWSNNQYVGLGISVSADEDTGGIRIVFVHKNSGADKAGLLEDDILLTIDGIDITQMEYSEALELLDGQEGDSLEFTVLKSTGKRETVSCFYEMVFTDPISYKQLDNDIGYVLIENFDWGVAYSFMDAVDELITLGVKSFIFDVRFNGGGRVDELTEMLDYLLPWGEIFVAVDKSGKERVTYSDDYCLEYPAVVLVNSYSYSAAEYFAATLSEYGFAQTVGEHTTGKNRSQITIELPNDGALHISSGEYLTPNRVSLYDTGGMAPDYEVPLDDDSFYRLYARTLPVEEDAQLLQAIALLS